MHVPLFSKIVYLSRICYTKFHCKLLCYIQKTHIYICRLFGNAQNAQNFRVAKRLFYIEFRYEWRFERERQGAFYHNRNFFPKYCLNSIVTHSGMGFEKLYRVERKDGYILIRAAIGFVPNSYSPVNHVIIINGALMMVSWLVSFCIVLIYYVQQCHCVTIGLIFSYLWCRRLFID